MSAMTSPPLRARVGAALSRLSRLAPRPARAPAALVLAFALGLACRSTVAPGALAASSAGAAASGATASSAGAPSGREATAEGAAARTFVGVLVPPRTAKLSPREGGQLVEVSARVGQTVRAGQVLARLDARERRHELAMAEAQLRAAKGNVASAGAELAAARQRASRRSAFVTVDGEALPIVSAEEASQSVLTSHGAAGRASAASAQVAEMRARVDQLKLMLDETDLRAPHDGVVTAVYFEPGMAVRPADVVVRVVGSSDALRVRVAVPEEARDVLPRARVLRLHLGEGLTLTADVDAISPEVDAASRTFLVEGGVREAMEASERASLAGRPVRASVHAEDPPGEGAR